VSIGYRQVNGQNRVFGAAQEQIAAAQNAVLQPEHRLAEGIYQSEGSRNGIPRRTGASRRSAEISSACGHLLVSAAGFNPAELIDTPRAEQNGEIDKVGARNQTIRQMGGWFGAY